MLWRTTQTDPLGTAGGPNLYGYGHNDPVNRVDPTGLAAETAGRALGEAGSSARNAVLGSSWRVGGDAAGYALVGLRYGGGISYDGESGQISYDAYFGGGVGGGAYGGASFSSTAAAPSDHSVTSSVDVHGNAGLGLGSAAFEYNLRNRDPQNGLTAGTGARLDVGAPIGPQVRNPTAALGLQGDISVTIKASGPIFVVPPIMRDTTSDPDGN